MLWALLPRWAKLVGLGAILAAGGGFWLYRRAYTAGQMAERLSANQEAVRLAAHFRAQQAAAVARAYREGAPAIRASNQLHDSTTVVDSVTVFVTLPAPGAARQAVVLPTVIVRRIVADSVALLHAQHTIATQAGLIAADSVNISALEAENRTLHDMKAPVCAGKCRTAAHVATVVVVAETVVRIAKHFKRD